MLTFLPAPLRGALALIGYGVNTLFWCALLFPAVLAKLVIPLAAARRVCNRVMYWLVERWVFFNNLNQRVFCPTRWEVEGVEGLDRSGWYLVLANHQSWADILVLQRIFHRRIPMLKFFLKKELIWVPVLGVAWWALEFPFMKRYSHRFLKRHPHLAGKDLEITRRACRKFKSTPVSIMNFVEGTRFTAAKHRGQDSPHVNLLRAKAGGIALVLGAMGEQLQRILDVTIVYPEGTCNFWQFVSGRVAAVKVRVRALPVDAELLGDYAADRAYRQRFQGWLNTLWVEKDAFISGVLAAWPLQVAHAFPARDVTVRRPFSPDRG
jgi:1-acyl-sn-glycerol-3-phosphate acyltransferase